MRSKNIFGGTSDDEDGDSKEAFAKVKGRSNVNYMLEKMNHTNKLKVFQRGKNPYKIIENEIIHQLYPASVGYNQIIEKLKIIKKVRIRCIIEKNIFWF